MTEHFNMAEIIRQNREARWHFFNPRTADVRTAGEFNVLDRRTAARLAKKAAAGAIGPRDLDLWRSAKEKATLELRAAG